jgi:AcrR family transcriptional regulator
LQPSPAARARKANGGQAASAPRISESAKGAQRDRLLAAIIEIAAEKGYPALTASEIIAHARVSRSAFYAQFQGKEDCFLAALATIAERLLADVRRAVSQAAPERARIAAADTLLSFAAAEQPDARLLLAGTLMGGSRSLDTRDELIARIAAIVDDRGFETTSNAAVEDLPTALLIGAVWRLLACSLNGGQQELEGVRDDLLAWIESYESPRAKHRWQTIESLPAPAPWLHLQPSPLRAPAPPPNGRARLSAQRLRENRRRRILFAAAEVIDRHGFQDTTVRQITRLAEVDGRVFYTMFADKQQVLAEVNDLLFGHVIAVTAGAFASGESWPERVWLASGALTQSLQLNPTLTRVALLHSPAAGAATARRVARLTNAFTIFLQEGYQQSLLESAALPTTSSKVALEAITTTVVELVCRRARAAEHPDLPGLSAHVAFIALAPFLGVRQAGSFVLERLAGRPVARSLAA